MADAEADALRAEIAAARQERHAEEARVEDLEGDLSRAFQRQQLREELRGERNMTQAARLKQARLRRNREEIDSTARCPGRIYQTFPRMASFRISRGQIPAFALHMLEANSCGPSTVVMVEG